MRDPSQKKLWENILEELPWDTVEDARERALSKAGERRYLYGKRKMTKTTETVRDKDVTHAGKDMGIKAFENKTAPDAAVEVLDPFKVKLKATVTARWHGCRVREGHLHPRALPGQPARGGRQVRGSYRGDRGDCEGGRGASEAVRGASGLQLPRPEEGP